MTLSTASRPGLPGHFPEFPGFPLGHIRTCNTGAEQPRIPPHYHAHAELLKRRADPLLPRAQPYGPLAAAAARAALLRVPLDGDGVDELRRAALEQVLEHL
eukprot:scaffold63262_cov64-Phaeocystis_antarctica.AAC.4